MPASKRARRRQASGCRPGHAIGAETCECSEKTWAGLRPGSPDGLPFMGPAPGIENLYVAAGHFRAGIQLSPGTGLLMKEMILGQPVSMPMDAFRLDR